MITCVSSGDLVVIMTSLLQNHEARDGIGRQYHISPKHERCIKLQIDRGAARIYHILSHGNC
jgi:hypothetical protein